MFKLLSFILFLGTGTIIHSAQEPEFVPVEEYKELFKECVALTVENQRLRESGHNRLRSDYIELTQQHKELLQQHVITLKTHADQQEKALNLNQQLADRLGHAFSLLNTIKSSHPEIFAALRENSQPQDEKSNMVIEP